MGFSDIFSYVKFLYTNSCDDNKRGNSEDWCFQMIVIYLFTYVFIGLGIVDDWTHVDLFTNPQCSLEGWKSVL